MAKRKKKEELGLGIRALLQGLGPEDEAGVSKNPTEILNTVCDIPLDEIEVNPFQPRVDFDQEALEDLANSIIVHGVIQPITVRVIAEDEYQLIAGERRLRASKIAGMKAIPAYIRGADDQAMLEMALIENIQRQDLNPIEVAVNYKRLLEECNLQHDQLGKQLGKSRSNISNYLQLLKLAPEVQLGLKAKKISMGHARALVTVKEVDLQLELYKMICEKGLSVRQVESLRREMSDGLKRKPKSSAKDSGNSVLDVHHKKILHDLAEQFDTKIDITRNAKGKGSFVFHFASDEEFNRILDLLP